jgi:hypothetical protein
MDPIERQQKRCYICLGYGHDQDDCPMKCENELNDLIPERHSAKLDRELEALQAKHEELVELIEQVHHEIKGITRCRVGFIGEYQVYCCQLERHRIDRLEAALRKAVEEK